MWPKVVWCLEREPRAGVGQDQTLRGHGVDVLRQQHRLVREECIQQTREPRCAPNQILGVDDDAREIPVTFKTAWGRLLKVWAQGSNQFDAPALFLRRVHAALRVGRELRDLPSDESGWLVRQRLR